VQIDTVRPDSTQASSGWTAMPSGTLHGVTSDDMDNTYALWSGTGSAMLLGLADHALPTDHQRHLARVRVRGQSADVNWGIRLTNGTLIAPGTGTFGGSDSTIVGSWGTGIAPAGAANIAVQVQGQATNSQVTELYVDIDSRLAPVFTPQVLDDGTPTTTVVDTNAPQVRASSVDLDGLPPRQYRYWVTQGVTIVWDTGVVSGPAPTRTVDPLENGSYEVHMQVWSTLGADTAYASVVEDLAFTVSTTVTQPPESVEIEDVSGEPYFDIITCAPASMNTWDGDEAYVEIQRMDCDGNTTRIALVGPISADECVTYRDWTAPRSLPAGCTETLDECPVTWRVRFLGLVNGLITASDWFGEPQPPVPEGLIVAWPGANAAIPDNWTRETSLDERYVKGGNFPSSGGGSATHEHTLSSHTHSLTHSHGGGGDTGAATGSYLAYTAPSSNFWNATSHTHTRPSTDSASPSSGSTTPTSASNNNDPDHLEVIWIRSNGNPQGLPDDSLTFMPGSAPSGWGTYTDATSRFLKGASAGADGGAQVAGSLANHTHAVGAHTHTGTSHTHTSSNTGSTSATIPGWGGIDVGYAVAFHSHPITIESASTGSTGAMTTSSSSGSTSPSLPPYRNLRAVQNTSGGESLPLGIMAAWFESDAPVGWTKCDGTSGTPDMNGFYPLCATSNILVTGGSGATHTHTGASHTHSISGHTHPVTIPTHGLTNSVNRDPGASPLSTVASHTHTHSAGSTASATPTVGSTSTGTFQATGTEPLYRQVTFIQFTGMPPVTGSEPVERTLYWTEGEHLVRANTPDGPVYVSACGELSWTVDRPFTVNQGVVGGRQVYSGAPGGHDARITLTVTTEAALQDALRVFDSALVLVSPADSSPMWASPVGTSIRVIKIGRLRQLVVPLVATGPEPQPEVF
jgi:hypothetical protein